MGVVAANAGEVPTFSVWVRDHASLERKIEALVRYLLPEADDVPSARSLLSALLERGALESTPPPGVEPDDDLVWSGSFASAWVATNAGAETTPSATRELLRRGVETVGALVGQFSSVRWAVRIEGSTVHLRSVSDTVVESPTPLNAWKALPSDAVFVGSVRWGTEGATFIERWTATLTGVAMRVPAVPEGGTGEIGVAARFDRTTTPDLLFTVTGDGRDVFLRELLSAALRAFAPNLPISAVKTEKRRILRWADADGWTFPVRLDVPSLPPRMGVWHATDGENLLIAVGERPDALDWYHGAKRRRRTLGEVRADVSVYGDAAWWFSPTAMLREMARVRGVSSPECATLSRLLEQVPASLSVFGSAEKETTRVTFDVREWGPVLAVWEAVRDLGGSLTGRESPP